MTLLRLSVVLALAGLCVTGTLVRAATMPFHVSDPDGRWKAIPVQREVAAGITCEQVVMHLGATDRLIVLRGPKTEHHEEARRAFAHDLIDSFEVYRAGPRLEHEATRLGQEGLVIRFDFTGDGTTYACELFVFAHEQDWWGLLYSHPGDGPGSAAEAFQRLQPDLPAPAGVVALPPYRTKGEPISSFPLSIRVERKAAGSRVVGITVTEVPERSATEQAGVKVGDAVVAIDGRPTTDFSVGIGKDSELGRIFLNRRPGDEVDLELQRPGAEDTYRVTLRVPRSSQPWARFRVP